MSGFVMLVGFRRAAGMAYKGGQIHCFNFAGQKQRRGLLCGGYTSNITEDMCVCVCVKSTQLQKLGLTSALVEACRLCLHYPTHLSIPKQNRLGCPSLALSFAYDTESFLELAKLRN